MAEPSAKDEAIPDRGGTMMPEPSDQGARNLKEAKRKAPDDDSNSAHEEAGPVLDGPPSKRSKADAPARFNFRKLPASNENDTKDSLLSYEQIWGEEFRIIAKECKGFAESQVKKRLSDLEQDMKANESRSTQIETQNVVAPQLRQCSLDSTNMKSRRAVLAGFLDNLADGRFKMSNRENLASQVFGEPEKSDRTTILEWLDYFIKCMGEHWDEDVSYLCPRELLLILNLTHGFITRCDEE